MRPAARIEAAIDIIDAVERGIAERGAPADVAFATYCRQRRYIGSKDRRAISDLVYGLIRARGLHVWRLGKIGMPVDGRSLVISFLHVNDTDALALFGGEGEHTPAAFSDEELQALEVGFAKIDTADMPVCTQLELPEWLEDSFRDRFGSAFVEGMTALNAAAPFDVRSNPITVAHDIINQLKNELEDTEKTKYSPICYRSYMKNNLQASAMYRNGLIEVQDEAAQIASYLVDAKSGMHVIDLCAGAGGKSLLMSALMENKGQIKAFDISGRRLRELEKRAARALCKNVTTVTLPAGGTERTTVLSSLAGNADRVVVDAPCSGTGTWRRNPDQRWRLSAEEIQDYATLQGSLLSEGSKIVKRGGRLIYMTCSLLEDENEAVVDAFMTEHGANWQVKPYQEIWADVLGSPPAETLSKNEQYLQLAPHKHQTDGFFVAILEKT